MKNIISHLRTYILRGTLAFIPIFLVYLVVRFVYVGIDVNVMDVVFDLIGVRIPGLGILFTLIFLYVLGAFSSNITGRWLLSKLEELANRIPLVGAIYKVGKQISNTLSLPEKQVFKKAVLIDFMKQGYYTIGFITGTIRDNETRKRKVKVFVPLPPNPASGHLLIVEENAYIDTGWSVEDAMKMVISAGIIGPDDYGKPNSIQKSTAEDIPTETPEPKNTST
jgi:uncharacterized membrane protein